MTGGEFPGRPYDAGGSWVEHLEWARRRAHAYLDTDLKQAVASFTSDLTKCPATAALAYRAGVQLTHQLLTGADQIGIARGIDDICRTATGRSTAQAGDELDAAMDRLMAYQGRPVCCVCEAPPRADAPLYRLNRRAVKPLWACLTHYKVVMLGAPGDDIERLDK